MRSMLESQIGKSTGIYRFRLESVPEGILPFMSASAINAIRRNLSEMLDSEPCIARELLTREPAADDPADYPLRKATYKNNVSNRLSKEVYRRSGVTGTEAAYELSHKEDAELMRTRYCIKHELGMCPVHQGAPACGPLFLLNNGQRFSLHFDCARCEMTVKG